jgi:hypothetical protein
MSLESPHFSCPGCGGKKSWKPQLAGKRAKCSCGHILTIPLEPPQLAAAPIVPATFEEAFEAAASDQPDFDNPAPTLSVAPAAARPAFTPPPVLIEREEADGSVSTVGTVARKIVRSETAALPRRKGLQREEKPPEPAVSPFRDFVLPGILIAAGVALCLLDGTYKGDESWVPLNTVVGPVIVNMLVSLAFAIGAVFAASAMGGVAFQEPIPVIIYKLCAVALAPGALGSLATHWIGGINGDIAGVFLGITCYFLLFLILFRIAMVDRVVCVMLLFIIRTAVAYMIFKLQGAKHGSEI